MRLIARKPCSFGGKKYFIGDEVPAEDVINPTVHERQGTLAIVKDEQGAALETAGDGKVTIPVIRDGEGDVADVLSIPLTEGDVDSEEVLIVLHAADSRSGVKKAAKKRAEQLSSTNQNQNESVGGNETTEDSTESDT